MTIRLSAYSASAGSWVAISTILSFDTKSCKAFFRSIPAFSISSINTIGDELKIAVSAIMSALDCPPLSAVIGVSSRNCSPASLLAASIIRWTAPSLSSTILLSACSSINSRTERSITKFIFCESCATNLLLIEKRMALSGGSPLIKMVLPVGVSCCAVHSMSASSLDLPEPVGPTIEII